MPSGSFPASFAASVASSVGRGLQHAGQLLCTMDAADGEEKMNSVSSEADEAQDVGDADLLLPTLVLSVPEEILQHIFSSLDASSLAAAHCVSRSWRRTAVSDTLWEPLTLSRYSWLTRRRTTDSSTWKQYYQRLATSESVSFVVLGGRAGASMAQGRRYALRSGEWDDLPQMAVERRGPALIRDEDGSLYALGGTGERALRSVERLPAGATCENGGAWEAVQPMRTARCTPAAALDGRGQLVVAGGGESMYRHAKVFASCEMLREGEWEDFPCMLTPRCAHSLNLCTHATPTLYATGGYGGNVAYLTSIEAIDLHATERGWRAAGQLPAPRAFASACVGPDLSLYVLGGTDNGSSNCASCLRWDPRTSTAHSIAPMTSPRHAFAAAFAPDGLLYVGGGFEWMGTLETAECYEPRKDAWRELPGLGAHLEFCAGAVVW